MNVAKNEQQAGSSREARLPPEPGDQRKGDCAKVRRPKFHSALPQMGIERMIESRHQSNDGRRPEHPTTPWRAQKRLREWPQNPRLSFLSLARKLREQDDGQREQGQPPGR